MSRVTHPRMQPLLIGSVRGCSQIFSRNVLFPKGLLLCARFLEPSLHSLKWQHSCWSNGKTHVEFARATRKTQVPKAQHLRTIYKKWSLFFAFCCHNMSNSATIWVKSSSVTAMIWVTGLFGVENRCATSTMTAKIQRWVGSCTTGEKGNKCSQMFKNILVKHIDADFATNRFKFQGASSSI